MPQNPTTVATIYLRHRRLFQTMVKLTRFEITLDKVSEFFNEGDVVAGNVHISLPEPMDAKAITLKFVGKAEVQWTERKSGNRTYTYSATEDYFEEVQLLWGGGSCEKLPAGDHTFSFACQLPEDLPSSFEGTYGYVRYYCKVKITRPWKFDSTCKKPFTVNGVLDLNKQPDATKPVSAQKDKYLRCLFCRSGPISVIATISKSAFVPGENIILNAEISNLSRDNLSRTRADIFADIIYYSTAKARRETVEIGSVQQGAIKAGHTELWSAVPITVPPVPPSFLAGCNIIEMHYYIKFVVVTPVPSFNLSVELPFLVGTIPLSDSADCPPSYTDAMHYTSSLVPSISEKIEQLPPSYLESIFGVAKMREKDDDKSHGPSVFAPIYPCYNPV